MDNEAALDRLTPNRRRRTHDGAAADVWRRRRHAPPSRTALSSRDGAYRQSNVECWIKLRCNPLQRRITDELRMLGVRIGRRVPDRGGDKATVVPIVLFGDVGGVLRSVHGRRACCARLAALVGVIAPIMQRFAITAITALSAGGCRNYSTSSSSSLFPSAPGPRKAAASLLLGQRVATQQHDTMCNAPCNTLLNV